jgi:hypothetical protein
MPYPLPAEVVYTLDAEDRIVSCGGAWNEFARENGGRTCLAPQVVGHKLWRFITGEPTRMFLAVVLSAARVRGAPSEHDYRCDSPTFRRQLRMRLVPEAKGSVRLEHRAVRVEPLLRRVELEMSGRTAPGGKPLVVRCSMCNRLKSERGWLEPDTGEFPFNGGRLGVVHSVCPECRESVRAVAAEVGARAAPLFRHG